MSTPANFRETPDDPGTDFDPERINELDAYELAAYYERHGIPWGPA